MVAARGIAGSSTVQPSVCPSIKRGGTAPAHLQTDSNCLLLGECMLGTKQSWTQIPPTLQCKVMILRERESVQ